MMLFGPYGAGRVTAFFSRVTAVCANSLPLADAPVFMAIFVLASITPSKCAVVPMATAPAVCQKMFLGRAPPFRITFVALAWVRVPAIWNIQTASEPPESVTFVAIETRVVHL